MGRTVGVALRTQEQCQWLTSWSMPLTVQQRVDVWVDPLEGELRTLVQPHRRTPQPKASGHGQAHMARCGHPDRRDKQD